MYYKALFSLSFIAFSWLLWQVYDNSVKINKVVFENTEKLNKGERFTFDDGCDFCVNDHKENDFCKNCE